MFDWSFISCRLNNCTRFGIMILEIFGIILASLLILYYYLTWHFDYWHRRGVIGPKPLPFVGTFQKSAVYLENFLYDQDKIYREYRGKAPFVGIFTHRMPELLILDPSLVNEIFVGKFKNFHLNYTNYSKENARLFSRNPFVLRDEEWKDNRADISPAFTTAKTRLTYPTVNEMCKRLTAFIKSEIATEKPMMDTKEITAKFTADVICSVAYGLEANAIADDNSEFLQVSHKLFTPSYWKLWFITFKSVFPFLFKYYEMPFVTPDIEKYFINLTTEAVQLRRQLTAKPDDYLNFLLKLQEKRNYSITDVAANTITFFLDAYETSSIVLTHALYRLAQNTHCQTKLRQELEAYNGNIDFEVLSNFEYLDHVLNETLRISPPGFTITKVCTEPIELNNYDGNALKIEKGMVIQIPIYSIHNDPELFANPNTFNPDRFDGVDMKMLRDEGKFFPFGHGPRMCLGMRYSTLLIKAAIAEIVCNFEISVNARTKEPVIVEPKDFLYLPVHNIFLDYKLIEQK